MTLPIPPGRSSAPAFRAVRMIQPFAVVAVPIAIRTLLVERILRDSRRFCSRAALPGVLLLGMVVVEPGLIRPRARPGLGPTRRAGGTTRCAFRRPGEAARRGLPSGPIRGPFVGTSTAERTSSTDASRCSGSRSGRRAWPHWRADPMGGPLPVVVNTLLLEVGAGEGAASGSGRVDWGSPTDDEAMIYAGGGRHRAVEPSRSRRRSCRSGPSSESRGGNLAGAGIRGARGAARPASLRCASASAERGRSCTLTPARVRGGALLREELPSRPGQLRGGWKGARGLEEGEEAWAAAIFH
jgi:hypothetical protein